MSEQSTLSQRCTEVLAWKRTGLLVDGELRKFAEKAPHAEEHQRLMWAETKTAEEAMELMARARPSEVPTEPTKEVLNAARGACEGFVSYEDLRRIWRIFAGALGVPAKQPGPQQ